jgi:phosphatidate cytidylyltransferase
VTEGEAAPAAPAEADTRNLTTRIIAAAVLIPLAVGIAYAGGRLWIALVTLVAIGLYVEWLMVVGLAAERRVVAAGVVALAVGGICLASGRIDFALMVLGVGFVAVALITPSKADWSAAGFLYAAVAEIASVVLRVQPDKGATALVFLLVIVWVTDSGGYFAGRGIGGPKLWPRVSPKKTWAGAAGGFVASLAVAAIFAAVGFGKSGYLMMIGGALSVVSQLGDLFESAVKRRFGVKDSSQIIPGHGGLLDRLDGFVAAVAAAALFGFLRGGADGVSRGLMVW